MCNSYIQFKSHFKSGIFCKTYFTILSFQAQNFTFPSHNEKLNQENPSFHISNIPQNIVYVIIHTVFNVLCLLETQLLKQQFHM